jgi:hypothetical protein
MTRGEWVKSRTDKRGWKAYHNARAHFPLCVLGRIVVLHQAKSFSGTQWIGGR